MGIIFQIEISKMKLFVVLCFIGAALAIPNPFTPPMEKETGLVIPDEYYGKGYSKGYTPSYYNKGYSKGYSPSYYGKGYSRDTFHTADQPTTQEESSVAELVVTEEDTTRDVTPQSSTTAKLYGWIAHYNKQMNIIFL